MLNISRKDSYNSSVEQFLFGELPYFYILLVNSLVGSRMFRIGFVGLCKAGIHGCDGLFYTAIDACGSGCKHGCTQGTSLVGVTYLHRHIQHITQYLHHERRLQGDTSNTDDIVDSYTLCPETIDDRFSSKGSGFYQGTEDTGSGRSQGQTGDGSLQ